jgi:ATP-dependent exoDNAse (exonuclease V) beta subunit
MAASFVQRRREASVREFIKYVAVKEVDVPFDKTGDTIKVLTYHKSKGLQWKMVILNSLHLDFLDEADFIKKDFSRLTVRTLPDGKVCFNIFPPADALEKIITPRIHHLHKAKELWDYLVEKKRAEELRLMYVGFTRAENYLISLSFGAVPLKWLEHTRVVFDSKVPKTEICDNSALDVNHSHPVPVLPYDKFLNKVEGKKKFISPSQCEADPSAELPVCELERIADDIDVARWEIEANVFGTCIHNYLAVHEWAPDGKHAQKNLKNADRVIEGFGLKEKVVAENLVKQADAFFAYIERNYGKVETIMHEIHFTDHKGDQVVTGEIDLYVKTEQGVGILADFKNPMTRKDVSDAALMNKASGYWPQLEAYANALDKAGHKVDQVLIYYPMLGVVAKF